MGGGCRHQFVLGLVPGPPDSAFTVQPFIAQGRLQGLLPGFLSVLRVRPSANSANATRGAAGRCRTHSHLSPDQQHRPQRATTATPTVDDHKLDQSLSRTLMSQRGEMPQQGCSFLTASESPPTVSLVIRLIGSEVSDD
ncbi:hypothetical protein Q8A67_025550 [Cirrhinus molitorella]|uniref:Uncharacterized protein n=1 Tax=Cirrhinus molitorella TaxID=172907 RepID=A0AA88T9S8_9TELE|nr:hypothetical protein Q8A67_025550 [Cirrhinus molitorella]